MLFWLDLILGVLGALALLGIATAAEFVAPRESYSFHSRVVGFAFSALNIAIGILLLFALQTAWGSLDIKPLRLFNLPSLAGDVASVVIAVLARDFLAYWHHRALHRWFWSVHVVHHSQTELHAANGYAHFLEKVTAFGLIMLPLSLLDFRFAATPVVVLIALQLMEYYIHSPSEAHLGPLGTVIVDNRFHRIHHSVEPHHFDKNFGIFLSVWDRIFATAYDPAPGEWPATGVEGYPPPRSAVEYALYPLRLLTKPTAKRIKPNGAKT
jgi:sterol desaturase/sphingolipid hydroxylase (fatty acid hydroxylase superfamily)